MNWEAFLEYHYYSGGLRIAHVSVEHSRPEWAPPAEWVGFRDEAVLTSTDSAVEIARFSYSGSVVAWIGVYKDAPDRVYGDRRNHSGVGVWLLNQFPSRPDLLVDSLERLVLLLGGASDEEFAHKARAYLSDFVGGYISPYRQLAAPLGGLRLATNQVLATRYFLLAREWPDWLERLSELFFETFFLSPSSGDENRVLILLAGKASTDRSVGSGRFDELKRSHFSSVFLSKIPSAFQGQTARVLDLEAELSRAHDRADDQANQLVSLQTALEAERFRAKTVEQQYADLKASLADNDEHRRFSILNDGLASLSSRLDRISRDVSSLRTNLMTDIQGELRSLRRVSKEPVAPNTHIAHVEMKEQKHGEELEISWWKVAALVVGILLFCLLLYIFYGLYQHPTTDM